MIVRAKVMPKLVSLRNMKFSRNPLMQVHADKWLTDEYSELEELYSSIPPVCDLFKSAGFISNYVAPNNRIISE
jgi:hypothetical protein